MRVERGLLFVEATEHGDIRIGGISETMGRLLLAEDEARWLAFVAIPAVLAALAPIIPPEPPIKVRDASNDEGQIAGQLAIE